MPDRKRVLSSAASTDKQSPDNCQKRAASPAGIRRPAELSINETSDDHTFERLALLSDLSMALSSGVELDVLIIKMAESCRKALHADEAYFLLLDPETFELVLTAPAGRPRRRPTRIKCPERRISLTSHDEYGFPPSPRVPDEDDSLCLGEALLMRNAFVGRHRMRLSRVRGKDTSPAEADKFNRVEGSVPTGVPFSSVIILPLITVTQTLGLFVVANVKCSTTFSDNDLEEAAVIANMGAMAVEHLKLVRERESRIREMEKLNTLAKRFSTVQTLEGLIGLSFEYLGQIIPHDLGVVFLFNNDEETRYFVANRPLSPRNLANLTEHIRDIADSLRGTPARIMRSQQIFLPNKEGVPIGEVFRRKVQSFLTVPLTVQGHNIGLINLSVSRPNAFNREHLRAFTTLSNLLATAIENVKIRLYLEKRIDELSVLFEIAQSLTSTLVIDEVLDSIVNFTMEMSHALRCELRLLDTNDEYLEIRASRGLSKFFLKKTRIKVGEGIIGGVISQKRPISVVDIRKDPRTKYMQLVKREKLAGLLAVPILQRGKPIGVITIYTSKPRDFTQSEIDLLSTFASQASVAIENARLYAKMKDQYLSMVAALAAAIETKDAYTHGHSQNVMEYAVKIGSDLGMTEEELETVKFAGLLHDIGKIGINDTILSKTGHLTPEEHTELRNHPKYGAFIMEQVDFLKDIAPLTLYHHERFDGTGYPLGLGGEEIPLGARILAVADTFDSMIADRPYRKGFPFDHVLTEMKKVSGSQLDPKVVEVFFAILRRENQLQKPNGNMADKPRRGRNKAEKPVEKHPGGRARADK
ncbi:MAG: GAF domain-containing protein [Candidatus Riflebacteria bacterium]|nr:GAF domain-containing protein [Candidatus Riflebacteria bacterium]